MDSENPFDYFDPHTGELPQTARSTFEEGAKIARETYRDLDSSNIVTQATRLVSEVNDHFDKVDHQKVMQIQPEIEELFDANFWESKTKPFARLIINNNRDTEFYNNNSTLKEIKTLREKLALLIFCILAEAKMEEEKALASPDLNLGKLAALMDQHIQNMSLFVHMYKMVDIGTGNLKAQLQVKSRVSKGGEAKAERTNELKAVVREEYLSKYQDQKNIDAARIIAGKIAKSWLQDDSGQELLADPVQTFSRWIGQFKKQADQKIN